MINTILLNTTGWYSYDHKIPYVSTLNWMVVVKKSGEALYVFSSFTNLSTGHAKLKGIKIPM